MCFLLLVLTSLTCDAQPFYTDIQQFKRQDSIAMPAQHAFLLVGSSSFTKWVDVQTYFPKHTIINRGFGGATLLDLIKYQRDIIDPYNPKQIVIYCGENDIAASDTVDTKEVAKRFKTLYENIRAKYPEIPILYISMKPSISRWALKDRMIDANKSIKKYLERKKKAKFLSIWEIMLDKNGMPLKDIFTDDNLHMNAKGYGIWQKFIEPVLVE